MSVESTIGRIASALADDLPIDWGRELARASSREERAAIEELQVLRSLATAHRRAAVGDDAAESVGASPPDAAGPPLGRWGHLDLIDQIGGGASAIVYRAWDRRLARHVALKLLEAGEPHAEDLIEARMLAQVRHSSVVTVFGADRIDGRVGLWMELIEGRTLEQMLAGDGPFSAREALGIAQDCCAALAAVHHAGLLHRDIKAQNIMREHGGRIVLMDFGAGRQVLEASHGRSIELSGTPLYMAPELFAGEAASVRSDLYSLGVLLFRLVSGSYPVDGTTLADVSRAHEADARRHLRDLRSELPGALLEIVERALDPIPERRFDSAGSMGRAIGAAMSDRTRIAAATDATHAEAPGGGANSGRRPAGRTALAVLLTAVVTAALVLLAEHGPRSWWNRNRAPVAAQPSAAVWSEPADAPAVGLTQQQRDLVASFEELAGRLGVKSDWAGAAEVYAQIRTIHRDTIGEFAPVSGLNIARTGWAHHRAGRLDDARYLYEEAVVKQESTLGTLHPYLATTMGALAMLHYQVGRVGESKAWLDRALAVRRGVLGVFPARYHGRLTLDLDSLPAAKDLAGTALLSDQDGDGLLPLIERAIGLDPGRADSDRDGTPDGDELIDDLGVSNCVAYCLAIDPTKVVAHYGSINPRRLGFFRHYPIEGDAVQRGSVAAWEMRTGPLGYYFHRLTSAQKDAAVESGWRLMLRGRVVRDGAYAVVDLTPRAGRWDVNLFLKPSGETTAHLTTHVVPLTGSEARIDEPETFPLLELIGSRGGRVDFYVNGTLHTRAHPGTRQFQDDRGLMFGSGSRTGQAGSGEFALVWLEIW